MKKILLVIAASMIAISAFALNTDNSTTQDTTQATQTTTTEKPSFFSRIFGSKKTEGTENTQTTNTESKSTDMTTGTTTGGDKTTSTQDTTSSTTTDSNKFSDQTSKISYIIGFNMGKNFKSQNLEINPQQVFQGITDSVTGNTAKFSEQEMTKTLVAFQRKVIMERAEQFKKESELNQKQGEDFLTKNKSKDGVVVLPSGLQYKVISQGAGSKPTKSDTVTVEYTGRLLNGNVFDSTDTQGKPATFKVSQVIPGWTEALQLMHTGDKWELYIPATLAYGTRGAPGRIGPNETLVFQVHLVSVDNQTSANTTTDTSTATTSETKSKM